MTIPEFILPVPLHRYRILFNDGECIDVIAPNDSSIMRDFALKQRQTQSKVVVMVSGVADLGLTDASAEAEIERRYGKTIDELADEAEAGYDPSKMRDKVGVPPE